MTGRHPGKTAAQRRVLDQIGCGNHSPIMSKATETALLNASLIERLSDTRIGTGPLSVIVKRFQMPTPVHLEWCLSCDDEVSS